MTFNPEGFADMKDKYFLLNGRSYPDTVTSGPLFTQTVDGSNHFSQPLSAIINIPAGKRALLRISDLDVSEYQTLASLGIPMQVIGYNAKLLRDQAGKQPLLHHQLDHPGWRRVPRRDPRCYGIHEIRGKSSISTPPILITFRTTRRTSAD